MENDMKAQAKFYEECWERGFYRAHGYHSKHSETKVYYAKVKNSERVFMFPGELFSIMKNDPQIEKIWR